MIADSILRFHHFINSRSCEYNSCMVHLFLLLWRKGFFSFDIQVLQNDFKNSKDVYSNKIIVDYSLSDNCWFPESKNSIIKNGSWKVDLVHIYFFIGQWFLKRRKLWEVFIFFAVHLTYRNVSISALSQVLDFLDLIYLCCLRFVVSDYEIHHWPNLSLKKTHLRNKTIRIIKIHWSIWVFW